jgi:hypothetical protein
MRVGHSSGCEHGHDCPVCEDTCPVCDTIALGPDPARMGNPPNDRCYACDARICDDCGAWKGGIKQARCECSCKEAAQ